MKTVRLQRQDNKLSFQIAETEASVETDALNEVKHLVELSLEANGLAILPPLEAQNSFHLLNQLGLRPRTTILDPWYNKGVGGTREDYKEYITELLQSAGSISDHVFFWGFPEIVARFIESIPEPLGLVAWLTWYYKNNPSVIRGWRSSQNACLHLSVPGARLFPEHFLNSAQKQLQFEKRLRYMPGPTSVIEEALLVGFVGKKQKTTHPAQKPVAVFNKLILMTTQEGELVFDPMSGSGTTGESARELGRKAILCDLSEEYIQIAEKRLGIERVVFPSDLEMKVA
jgi:site-specific DNA-methyltransferase (adenine-specific)